MSLSPFNPLLGQTMKTAARGVSVLRAFVAHLVITAAQAVAASTTGIHAAVVDNGAPRTVTTAITNPAYPRNVTATAGGTATDIKAIQVTVHGTDMDDQVISEVLPAFTVDTAGTVTGAKIFKTITQIDIPAHDGTGATTAVGWGSKLGIPHKLAQNTVPKGGAYLNHTREATEPTVTVDSANLCNNGFTLNSGLNGTQVDLYYWV